MNSPLSQSAFAVFVLVFQLPAIGQQPDAAIGSVENATVEGSQPAPPLPAATAAAVQAIRDSNPTTPAELLDSVQILVRFEQYELAKEYLNQLVGQQLDAPALIALHRRFGSGLFVRLAREPGLSPEGRTLSMQVLQAARQQQENPQRLARLVVELGDESADVRRAALLDLAEVGESAVPALITALSDPSLARFRPRYRQALSLLGAAAEDPLLAVLSSPEKALQSDAAYALAYVGSSDTVPYLLRPYFASEPYLQQAADYALRRLSGTLPRSVADAAVLLRRRATLSLDGLPPSEPDEDGQVTFWTWDANQKNVVANRINALDAAALTAVRFARDLYVLRPADRDALQLLVASRLMADQRLGGMDQPLRKGPGTAYALAVWAGPNLVDDVLASALKQQHHAMAVAAAEVLGDIGDVGLLLDVAGKARPLAQATRSANRRVQFAAARAIMKIDPRQPYPGASFFTEALGDLAAASGRRRALIGHPRIQAGSSLAGMLADLGFEADIRTTGVAFLKAALSSEDYDFLLVSDLIDCPAASELLQQLRKDPHAAETPAALLSSDGREWDAQSLAGRDPLVITFPEYADRPTLANNVQEMLRLTARDHVPPQRRLEQASQALGWLTHLARYSATYPWYDLMRQEPTIEKAVDVPELAVDAATLLGYLGDAASQANLIDLASQSSLPLNQRQLAVDAFTEAVLRRGLMLTNPQIATQYTRHNASVDADREIYSQILDAIESQLNDRDARLPVSPR